MKDPNKKSSFLFTLYQKYKKKLDEPNAVEADSAQALIAETMEEVRESAIPPEKTHLQPLYELYRFYLDAGILEGEPLELLPFEAWCLSPLAESPDHDVSEIDTFERMLCKLAEQLLPQLLSDRDWIEELAWDLEQMDPPPAAEPTTEPGAQSPPASEAGPTAQEEAQAPAAANELPKPPARDAMCRVYITQDKMTAYLFVLPPYNGGKDVDREILGKSLEESSVTYGLDILTLSKLAQSLSYFQIFPVAKGTLPVDGKDGVVIPQIDCSPEIEIRQNEQGISDFKNINSVRSAVKDQVICAIVPPEPGIPGMTVKGQELRARDGQAAADPAGKNTVLSEDKTRLLAGLDGQITLRNGRYHMEPVLVIDSNVDYGVGNINFAGDVVINGDVCNGFTVKADGSITIQGMVESATLEAGGDIIINKGMNGDFNGHIDAQGMVKTSFLENCTVYSEGPLHASSIVTSQIFCGDTVYVTEKHGAIIGGTITAYKGVEAKVIGSQSHRETEITLGELPRMKEKKTQAEEDLKIVRDMLDKLNKNINYLSGIESELPPDKQAIYSQLKLQQNLYEGRRQELTESLAELSNAQRDYSQCKVKCDLIYPPARITIGPETLNLQDTTYKATIYLTSGGMMVGML